MGAVGLLGLGGQSMILMGANPQGGETPNADWTGEIMISMSTQMSTGISAN